MELLVRALQEAEFPKQRPILLGKKREMGGGGARLAAHFNKPGGQERSSVQRPLDPFRRAGEGPSPG
jgi:hypothetical protein